MQTKKAGPKSPAPSGYASYSSRGYNTAFGTPQTPRPRDFGSPSKPKPSFSPRNYETALLANPKSRGSKDPSHLPSVSYGRPQAYPASPDKMKRSRKHESDSERAREPNDSNDHGRNTLPSSKSSNGKVQTGGAAPPPDLNDIKESVYGTVFPEPLPGHTGSTQETEAPTLTTDPLDGQDFATKAGRVMQSIDTFDKKEKVGEFCERVQVHGLVDWYIASSPPAKIFWLALLLIFTGVLISEIVKGVNGYITNPIKTTMTVTTANSLPMPPMYICPLNFINSEKVEKEGLEELKKYLLPYLMKPPAPTLLSPAFQEWERVRTSFNSSGLEDLHSIYPEKPTSLFTLSEFEDKLLKISFTGDEVIRRCEFQNILINCTQMITRVVDPDYGVCYRLDSGLSQTIAGAGLRLLIDVNADNYATDYVSAFYTGSLIRFGEDAQPFVLGGHLAGPGKYVRFAVEKRYGEFITVPHSITPQYCIDDGDEAARLTYIDADYSRIACGVDCLIRKGFANCSCLPKFDRRYIKEKYWESKVCDGLTFQACYAPILLKEVEDLSCQSSCHRKCKGLVYGVQESSMEFGTQQMRNIRNTLPPDAKLSPTADPSYWQRSLIVVEVAHDKLEYVSVVQSPAASVTQLIADIGGQTGLWLGASIFSLFQIGVLAISWCCGGCMARMRGQKSLDKGLPHGDVVIS